MAHTTAHGSAPAALTAEELVQVEQALGDAIAAVRRREGALDEAALGKEFAEALRRYAVDGAPWARQLIVLGIAGEWPDFSAVLRRNGIDPV